MARQINISETVTLHPTGYDGSQMSYTNASYPISNGYTDLTSTTEARIYGTSTTSGYVFYTFDTPEIPLGAVITVTGQARMRVSSTNSAATGHAQLYSGSTVKGSDVTMASTTTTNLTLSTGNSWSATDIENLRLRVGLSTTSTTSNSRYLRFYGAVVTISYSATTTLYEVNASSSVAGVTIAPSSQEEYAGGTTSVFVVATNTSSIVVKDNGNDVTSQLVYHTATSNTTTLFASAYNLSNNATINSGYPITNVYGSADDTSTYARMESTVSGVSIYTELLFDTDDIPAEAIITNVSARARLRYTNVNNRLCQLYSGSTPKGNGATWNTTNSGGELITLDTGSWTVSELGDLRMRISAMTTGTNSQRVHMYGADVTITYQDPSGYTYTISNIAADHSVVVSAAGGSTSKIYLKQNNSWVQYSKVYKKINGSWVEQSDIGSLFSTTANYVKGN